MNSISFKRFLTNWAKFAALRILLFSGSCSLFFGSAASANTTTNNYWDFNSVQSVLNDLNFINQYTHGSLTSLQTIEGYLHGSGGVQEELNWIFNSVYRTEGHAYDTKGYLYQIFSKLNSWQRTQDSYLTNILYAINSKSGSGSGGSDGSDILAGNPWWYTNSTFTLTKSMYSYEYPDGSQQGLAYHSFPQFMSKWSSLLTHPQNAGTVSPAAMKNQWFDTFGVSRQPSRTPFSNMWPYTWFDWMADANKSNLVIQAQVLSALRGISNAPSGGSFEDVLAGNPWWATNSAFARNWQAYNLVYPVAESGYSFPEAFSAFLAGRTTTAVSRRDLVDSFGIDGINQGHLYTFDDWLAEWLKSNMVLTTATSYSNLAAEIAATDYTEDSLPTNTPLPNYRDFIADADTSAAQDSIVGAESILQGKIEDLSGRIGYGNAEIVLIPAMTVGGIQVREVRASLDSPITGVAHAICVFIWYVALFASLFHLASCEFAFYANLGRNWVSGGGFITSKETGEYFS